MHKSHIIQNQHLHIQIFNGEKHENTLLFPLGPFSKQMDKYKFVDLKSSEIGKLCSKFGNEVKLASFPLALIDIYDFEDL